MAILNIFTDKEFLHKKSKPVTDFDDRLHMLLDDMRETMVHNNGIGIAGPQVGVLWRVCLVMTSGGVLELVNPEILIGKRIKRGPESCLSLQDESDREIMIDRPNKLTVRANDRNGKTFDVELKGIEAICASHEIDHLNGVIISDYKGDA